MENSTRLFFLTAFLLGLLFTICHLIYLAFKRIFLNSINRKYHYNCMQITLLITIAYLVLSGVCTLISSILSRCALMLGYFQFGTITVLVYNFLNWILPFILLMTTTPLVSANALKKGQIPYYCLCAVVLLSDIPYSHVIYIVRDIIFVILCILQLRGYNLSDEYKAASNAIWPEDKPGYAFTKNASRKNRLQLFKTFLPVLLISLFVLALFLLVFFSSKK